MKQFSNLKQAACGLLLATVISCTMGACSNEGLADLSDAHSIGFSTSIFEQPPVTPTRGTPIALAANLTDMGVFCYYTGFDAWGTAAATATPDKMNNVKWTQEASEWSTTNPVNWGTQVSIAEKFTFFGYAPYATGTGADGNGLEVINTTGTPKLRYTVPTDMSKQPDLMIATTKDVHPTGNKVPMAYKHALTCIAFKAKGTGQIITAVKVKGVSDSGILSLDATGNPTWSNLSTPGNIEYTAGLNSTTGITTTTSPTGILAADGYLMMIPQTLTASAQLIVTIDGQPQTFNLNAQNLTTWQPGQMLTYTIETKPPQIIVDYTNKKASNSYILNPNSSCNMVYRFPVKRVNEFWADADNTYGSNDPNYALGATDAWTVSVEWQTDSYVMQPGTTSTTGAFISKATGIGPDDYFEITVPQGYNSSYDSNVLVKLIKTGKSSTSWSWHLWVTTYNPYGTATVLENARTTGGDNGEPWVWSVPGGKLFRLRDPSPNFNSSSSNSYYGIAAPWATVYAGKRIMDRPIGGTHNYTLCYQFGRKDPFPAPSYAISHGNYYLYRYQTATVVLQRSGTMTLTYSVQRPDLMISNTVWYPGSPTYITDVLHWCSTTANNISTSSSIVWHDPKVAVGSGGKSIFDPSPYGFRLPENGTFKALFASDGQYITNTSKYTGAYEYKFLYTRSPTPYTYSFELTKCNQISGGYRSDYNIMGYNDYAFCSSSPSSDVRKFPILKPNPGLYSSFSSYNMDKSGAYTAFCIEDNPE